MIANNMVKKRAKIIPQILDGIRNDRSLLEGCIKSSLGQVWQMAYDTKNNPPANTKFDADLNWCIDKSYEVTGLKRPVVRNFYVNLNEQYFARTVLKEQRRLEMRYKEQYALHSKQEGPVGLLYKSKLQALETGRIFLVPSGAVKKYMEEAKNTHYVEKIPSVHNFDAVHKYGRTGLVYCDANLPEEIIGALKCLDYHKNEKVKTPSGELTFLVMPYIMTQMINEEDSFVREAIPLMYKSKIAVERLHELYMNNIARTDEKVQILTSELNMSYTIRKLINR